MRVVIVGAGADGSHLAERLSSEGQDVSVIEVDPDRANGLRERLDALVITGNGASPAILRKAGADKADLLVAVSDNDAANIVACQTGAALGASRTVVRVEDSYLHSVLPTLGLETVIDSRGTTARRSCVWCDGAVSPTLRSSVMAGSQWWEGSSNRRRAQSVGLWPSCGTTPRAGRSWSLPSSAGVRRSSGGVRRCCRRSTRCWCRRRWRRSGWSWTCSTCAGKRSDVW